MERKLLLSSLLLLMASVFIGNVSYGQNDVYHLSEQIDQPSNGSYSVEELAKGVVPTNYFRNGVAVNTEGGAIRMIIDPSSLSVLSMDDPSFEEVEIIIINMESESAFDSSFPEGFENNFPALKYVYYNCFFELCGAGGSTECQKQSISNHFHGSPANLKILYTAELPN